MKVPVYDNFQASPTVAPQSNFTAPSINNYGLKLSEDMGNTVMQAGEAFGQIVDKIDTNKAQAATNTLKSNLYALQNSEDSPYLKQGEEALKANDKGEGLVQQYETIYDTMHKEAAKDLNDRQKEKYMANTAEYKPEFNARLTSHVIKQQKEYSKNTHLGTIKIANDAAVADYLDPRMVENNKRETVAASDGIFAEEGYSADHPATQAGRIESLSLLNKNVIERSLTENNIPYAKAYYDSASKNNELTPNDREVLKKAIDNSTDLEWAQKYADNAVAGGLSVTQAMRGLSSQSEGKKRKVAEEQVQRTYQLADYAKKATDEKRLDAALTTILKDGKLTPVQAEDLKINDPKAYAEAMRFKEAAEKQALGQKQADNPTMFNDLRNMAATNPEKFAKENPKLWVSSMSTAEVNSLVTIQNDIIKQNVIPINDEKALNETIRSIQVDLKQNKIKVKDDAAFESALYMNLKEANEANLKSGKSRMTKTELKDMALSLTKTYVRNDSWFDKEKKGYEITPEEKSKYVIAKYDDIPKDDKIIITEAYKSATGKTLLNDDDKQVIAKRYSDRKTKSKE